MARQRRAAIGLTSIGGPNTWPPLAPKPQSFRLQAAPQNGYRTARADQQDRCRLWNRGSRRRDAAECRSGRALSDVQVRQKHSAVEERDVHVTHLEPNRVTSRSEHGGEMRDANNSVRVAKCRLVVRRMPFNAGSTPRMSDTMTSTRSGNWTCSERC